MNKYRVMILSLVLSVMPTLVRANCNDANTTADLNACFTKEYKFYDEKLSKTYTNLLSVYEKADKNELIRAQRLWVQYKEADCKAVAYSYREGSIGGWVGVQCLRDKSIQREAELSTRFEDYRPK